MPAIVDGVLVLAQLLWSALDEDSQHRRPCNRRDLIQRVERAGYVVLRATSFMALTLPLPLVSRACRQNAVALAPAEKMRLNAVVSLGSNLVRSGHRVLSHCGMGFNRSALVAGLILHKMGMEGPAIVERLRARRPGALFNDVFARYVAALSSADRP